jgi:hypothetical protein
MVSWPKYLCLLAGTCAVGACSSTPAAALPDMPSYATDVLPIFTANCIRCHGAGGMLNAAPNPDGSPNTVGMPVTCYLSMYEDTGDCSVGDGGIISSTCKRGAHYCGTPSGDPPTSLVSYYILILTQDEGGMPPPPWPPLGAREKEVIRRWTLNPIP